MCARARVCTALTRAPARLDLEFNHIEDNEDVRCLSLNKQLRALQLRANPLARAQFYRVSVVHMLPQLLELDGVPVHGSLAASGAGATHHLARSAPVGGASRGASRAGGGSRAGGADTSGVLNASTRTNVELDPMLAQWMAREMLHGLPAASPGNLSSAAAALDGEPASKQLLGVPDMPRRAGSAGQAAGRAASPLPPAQIQQQPLQLSASLVRQSSAVPSVTYEGTGVRYTGPRQSVTTATMASTAASRNDSAHAASHRLNASGMSAASASHALGASFQHRDAPPVGIIVSRASADTSALQQSGLNASSSAANPPSYLGATYASTRRTGAPSAPMAAAHSLLSASSMSAAGAAVQSSSTLAASQSRQQQQQQRSHSASRARPGSSSLAAAGSGALGATSVSPARRSLSAQRAGGAGGRSTSTGSALSASSSRVTTTFATSNGAARVVGTGHRASDALTRMQIDSEELTQRVSSLYAEVVGAGLPPDSAVPASTQHSAAARLSQSDPSGFGGAGVMRGRVAPAPSTAVAPSAAAHPPSLSASHSQRSLPRSGSLPGSSGAAPAPSSADADLAPSTRVYIEGQLDRHRTVLSELAQHSASASASASAAAAGAASLPSFDNRVLSIAELLALAVSSGLQPGSPLRWLHEDAGSVGTPQPPASSSSTSTSMALRALGASPSGLPPMAAARAGSPLRNSPSGAQLLAAPSTMSLAGSSVSVHSASGSSIVSPSAASIQGGASRGAAPTGDEVCARVRARALRACVDVLTPRLRSMRGKWRASSARSPTRSRRRSAPRSSATWASRVCSSAPSRCCAWASPARRPPRSRRRAAPARRRAVRSARLRRACRPPARWTRRARRRSSRRRTST